jgi:DNA polymerase-3 subunit epsilon
MLNKKETKPMLEKIMFIDVETTGTDYRKNAMIQLAGIITIDGIEQESFDFKIKPFENKEIVDEALVVTGTTREILNTYEEPIIIFKKLTDILNRYIDKFNREDKFHLVGYNCELDDDFLRQFFLDNKDPYFGSWFYFPPIDVCNLIAYKFRKIRYTIPGFKLMVLAK